jgi:hypothetical protein
VTDEPYRVPIRRTSTRKYVAIVAVAIGGGVVLIVFAGGWFAKLWGGAAILVGIWMAALRRGAPATELVIDRGGIAAPPQWRLDWVDVTDVRIGAMPNGAPRLDIVPRDPDVVRRQLGSRLLRASSWVNFAAGMPIAFPASVLGRPLDEILAACAEKRGL